MMREIIKSSLIRTFLLTAILSLHHTQAYAENFTIREVKGGDTFFSLCARLYGSCNDSIVKTIKGANLWLKNPNFIKVGDKIQFPHLDGGKGRKLSAFGNKGLRIKAYPIKESAKQTEIAQEGPEEFAIGASNNREKKLVKPSEIAVNVKLLAPVNYEQYPSRLVGRISTLDWYTDDRAVVSGNIRINPGDEGSYKFIVSVEGDLDYEQDFKMSPNGDFNAYPSVGRPNRDYDKSYTLRMIKIVNDKVVDQLAVTVTKKLHNKGKTIIFDNEQTKFNISGIPGLDRWIKDQSLENSQVDNKKFKTKDGLVIKNYRYVNYSPDEKYLGRYGRVTLYGSSCIAKYLIIKGQTETAKKIIDVWCNLIDEKGGIPRSANVVGDNYISPDVRTGDMAYFLGALALYKAATSTQEYDDIIRKLLYKYFIPLQDQKTGLVRGGYSSGSNGYTASGTTNYVAWASAEHNFDLFQSLVLLSRLFSSDDQIAIKKFYKGIGEGLDNYMWNKETNTFNRGYRFEAGEDKAKALDCSSWGALYLLKQATLSFESNDYTKENIYLKRAEAALSFIENNFKARWCYITPEGKKGCIEGYKPYAGTIDDVKDEMTNARIDWDKINDMVWSEGTLGVAIAQYRLWCKKPSGLDTINCSKIWDATDRLIDNMLELQSLGQTGGLLYSSKRIEGHFTQGEELASLAWLGYVLIIRENAYQQNLAKYVNLIPW